MTDQDNVRTYANDLSENIRLGKYMLFDRPPQPSIFQVTTGFPTVYTAGAAQVDSIIVPGALGNNYLEMYQTTAQALPPVYSAAGLLIGGDAVDNESLELVPGGNRAENPFGYLAGTGPGVFMRATLDIADTSEYDQLVVGWRKQEAYAVPVSFLSGADAGYTDFAGIGFSGTAAANLVKTMTDLNNSGVTVVTSTAFAWADAGIHTLEVRIKGRKVEYLINGARCGDRISKNGIGAAITAQSTVLPPTYTVDAGDFMIPFIFVRRGATSASALALRRLEVGQLLEVGLAPEQRVPQPSN